MVSSVAQMQFLASYTVPDSLLASNLCFGSFLKLIHTHMVFRGSQEVSSQTWTVSLSASLGISALSGPVTWGWGSLKERQGGMVVGFTTNYSLLLSKHWFS